MQGKTIAIGLAAALAAGAAHAQTKLVVVSWGGAYSASQQKAYYDPYMAMNPEIEILNDDSASEGLSKLRAMAEANNVTWDLVDMIASDAITACDEGLVLEIDFDNALASAPDGTSASEDFGDMIVSECFIPQIVYSTTFGYRTDLVKTPPTTIGDVFDLEKIPGKRGLEKKPLANIEWALLADGVALEDVYDMLSTREGIARAYAKLDTIKSEVVWWAKGAVPVQLLADGEVVIASAYNGRLFSGIEEEEKQPIAMMWDWQWFDLDGWVVPKGGEEHRRGDEAPSFRDGHATARGPGEIHPLRSGPDVLRAARQQACDPRDRDGAAHADRSRELEVDASNNIEWWADHGDEMNERFNAWLAKG